MSGIGGIFNLDGSPVDREKMQRVSDTLRQRGPDGLRIWEGGPLALVHSHFWTTPEEVGEEQPITRGSLTLAADARIDNRDELVPLLTEYLSNEVPSDAGIILAAYQKWQEDAPRHLIGDFAFAIWDEEEQRLFCARDPVGVRLFQYAQIGTSFVFGSSVGTVIAALDAIPEINIPFIADLLADRWERWVHETGYQEVFRLPPAYSLTVSSEGMAMQRYWTFGADQRYHFDTDEEYIACFRELFQEAVRCRMRAVGPVALSVSGGLDSSSIACVVNDLIERGEIEAGPRMYSHVYERTPRADEKEYFDAVAACCTHLPVTLIPSDDLWALQEFGDDNGYPMDEPEYSGLRSHLLTLVRCAKKDGCRICVDGNGGDMTLFSFINLYSFFIKDLSLLDLFSEFRHFSPFRRPHRLFLPNQRILTCSDLSPFRKKILIHIENRMQRKQIPVFLTPVCVPTTSPSDFLPPPHLKSRSGLGIYDSVTDGFNSAMHICLDVSAAYAGFEWRHPFYDRRIIDLMLSLPPSLCFHNGYSRYILRQVMVGLLPEKIRIRKTKSTIQDLVDWGLQKKEKAKIQSLIEDSLVAKLNLVNADRFLKEWESFWKGDSIPGRPLEISLCAEAWLRFQEKIQKHHRSF